MSDFEVVPDAARNERPTSQAGRKMGPLNAAIQSGQTVFVPLNGATVQAIANRARSTASRYNKVVRSYRTNRDGVEGVVLWAEPKAGS